MLITDTRCQQANADCCLLCWLCFGGDDAKGHQPKPHRRYGFEASYKTTCFSPAVLFAVCSLENLISQVAKMYFCQ